MKQVFERLQCNRTYTLYLDMLSLSNNLTKSFFGIWYSVSRQFQVFVIEEFTTFRHTGIFGGTSQIYWHPTTLLPAGPDFCM